ncbi:PAS domain S-box protein [uncultured Draconibacterium sp.]|uniref:PAS domain S-box protein n=1 Tax=uncultured Draconibacterium sp. TaxID=1573823 RepID=UPI002AA865E8|nr:PAS domain S-box protein [uncultured Draconibacterium sp.]
MVNFNSFRKLHQLFKKKKHEPCLDSEVEYREIVENSLVGVYIIQNNTFKFVNKRFCEISGYAYDEIVDKMSPTFLVFESDKGIVKENIRKRISKEKASIEYEFRGVKKDGSIVWLGVLGNLITFKGKPAISGTVVDITERKKVEDALHIREERLRETLVVTKIGTWEWNVAEDTWLASPIYYTMLGYEPVVGPSDRTVWLNRVHPEDRANVKAKINDVITNEADRYIYEARMLHADGTYRWHQVIGHTIEKDNLGKIKRMVGIRKDITDFKQAEEELRISENRLRVLIDTLPDLVWLKNPHGVYLQCNQRFEQFYGATEKEIVGKTDYDFVSKDLADFFRQKDNDAAVAGKPTINEEELTFADGHKEILETIKTPMYESDGTFMGVLGIGRDITQRKKSKQELIKNEAIISTAVENLPIVFFLIDKDGIFNLSIGAGLKGLGLLPNQVVGQSVFDLYKDYPKTIEAIKKALAGEFVNFESNVNGVHYLNIVHPMTISGKRVGIVGVGLDITERKKANESLKLFSTLIDNSNDAFEVYDPKTGRVIDVNETGHKTLGYSREEFLKLSVYDIDPFVDKNNFKKNIQELRKSEFRTWQSIHKRKDGSTFPVEVNIRLVKLEKEYLVSVARDISLRKQNEELVVKLSHAVEQSPVSIIITDKNGNIEYSNPKTFEVSGYKKEEVLGKNPRIFSSGDRASSEYKALWENLLAGKEWKGEFQNRKKNGELFWEFVYISPILNATGEITHFVAIKEDITERRKMIEELIYAKNKAEESDRLKSAFLANMSHEIRTPMNGILGFASLLKEPELSGELQNEYIQIIEKSGARMLNIINDIVSISQIESGIIDINLSETNINSQLQFVYDSLKLDADHKDLNFSFTCEFPESRAVITTDIEKFYGILLNLVKNAIKYTDKGTVEFGYVVKGEKLEFYVKDTGIGISNEKVELIFERFIQADITDKMARQGAGLGLSISKAYVEMLGGEIWVDSEESKGSTFFFTLPRNVDKDKKVNITTGVDPDTEAKTFIPEKSGLKVLIAEDDEASEMLMSIKIQKFSREILKVNTGTNAIETCLNNPDIDLILMDIQMPGMNGYEATRKIREFNKKVIIIAQTAFALEGDKEKAIEAGCNNYISKPISQDELLSLVQFYFAK